LASFSSISNPASLNCASLPIIPVMILLTRFGHRCLDPHCIRSSAATPFPHFANKNGLNRKCTEADAARLISFHPAFAHRPLCGIIRHDERPTHP
jgi:hypothetical protein